MQRIHTGRVIDQAEIDIIRAWARTWDAISDDLEKLIHQSVDPSLSQMRRRERAREALRIVSMELTALAEAAGVRISDDAATLIMAAIDDVGAAILLQRPVGVVIERIDSAQVAAMVKRTTERIHSRKWPLTHSAEQAMKRNLARGVALGEHPNRVARRMVRDTEGIFNGALARARNIARTEMMDAHRAAAAAMREVNTAVTGWMWIAQLGPRTCPACWGMHGSVHPPEEFGPYGHPSCRCVSVPLTKSWADLGFDGIDEPPFPMADAETVFANLDESDQKRILGPARHEAYKRGDYPIGEWAVEKTNPGWRRSVTTSPIPSGYAAITAA